MTNPTFTELEFAERMQQFYGEYRTLKAAGDRRADEVLDT